jgi:hypothetical protein
MVRSLNSWHGNTVAALVRPARYQWRLPPLALPRPDRLGFCMK